MNTKLKVTGDEKEVLVRHRSLKKKVAKLSSLLSESEKKVLDIVVPKVVSLWKSDGHTKSVECCGMLFTWRSTFSRVALKLIKKLKKCFGKNFKRFFRRRVSVRLKQQFMSKARVEQMIEELGGEEIFSKYFEVDAWIEPTERYVEERYRSASLADNRNVDKFVNQAKPSIRLKTEAQ